MSRVALGEPSLMLSGNGFLLPGVKQPVSEISQSFPSRT